MSEIVITEEFFDKVIREKVLEKINQSETLFWAHTDSSSHHSIYTSDLDDEDAYLEYILALRDGDDFGNDVGFGEVPFNSFEYPVTEALLEFVDEYSSLLQTSEAWEAIGWEGNTIDEIIRELKEDIPCKNCLDNWVFDTAETLIDDLDLRLPAEEKRAELLRKFDEKYKDFVSEGLREAKEKEEETHRLKMRKMLSRKVKNVEEREIIARKKSELKALWNQIENLSFALDHKLNEEKQESGKKLLNEFNDKAWDFVWEQPVPDEEAAKWLYHNFGSYEKILRMLYYTIEEMGSHEEKTPKQKVREDWQKSNKIKTDNGIRKGKRNRAPRQVLTLKCAYCGRTQTIRHPKRFLNNHGDRYLDATLFLCNNRECSCATKIEAKEGFHKEWDCSTGWTLILPDEEVSDEE